MACFPPSLRFHRHPSFLVTSVGNICICMYIHMYVYARVWIMCMYVNMDVYVCMVVDKCKKTIERWDCHEREK
jgi:hypothetical protein